MKCSCTCQCDSHETCGCQLIWCSCIIDRRKNRKRRKCPYCEIKLETDVLTSVALGHFAGQFCSKCGLIQRISDIFEERKNAYEFLGIKIRPQEKLVQP